MRQKETEHEWGRVRERETQNLKQAPGCELSAESPTQVSDSRTARSWPEPKSDLNGWATLAPLFRILFVRFMHMHVTRQFSLLFSIRLHKYTTSYLFTTLLMDSHVVSSLLGTSPSPHPHAGTHTHTHTHTRTSWCTQPRFSLMYKEWNHRLMEYVHLQLYQVMPNCFPKSVNQSTRPPAVAHGSYYSTFSPTFGIIRLSNSCQFSGCEWYLVVELVLFFLVSKKFELLIICFHFC